MNTLMQMGPMMVMEGPNGMHQAFPQPSQHIQQPPPITSSMNRSQRCGVCRGCQCKPCGQCTYCQDSPQFGGPGVKKQSCIERRCLRVLENRLQRDAPTFKARVGCNQCEDCRMPDCQICLVCLDKRFFENRYMTGAMCAKKRCNNATSIELPAQSPQSMHEFQQRQAQKRAYDQAAPPPIHFDMKRRGMEVGYGSMSMQQLQPHSPQVGPPPPQALGHPQGPPGQQNARILAINPAMNYGEFAVRWMFLVV
ncbi:CXXC zinc finger domain protein [Ancylostoma ceylanicum]|uniref:CXXC zinc finger domain protein n=1 Tax=Ancylostoma ceylanicum TaxID=53326 RepID=A0A0D6M7H4_9BILA|nr:CXXC zinc finger domain protein [Ancylostoma ceylanicum]